MHFTTTSAWATALAYVTLICHSYAFRNVIWHLDITTDLSLTMGITHVVIAFVDPIQFSTNAQPPSPPILPVGDVRGRFDHTAKIGISLGGWGSFSTSFGLVSTEENRTAFAANLATWVEQQGYDFVDIDWEYPGGNGAGTPTNATAEIENFPLLLGAIKQELKDRFITLSVAGTPAGMEAFKSAEQTKSIWDAVDFITVMAYDFINRASNTTGHHTDFVGSELAVQRYIDLGLPADKINLGFAFYAKYFEVEETCTKCMLPSGCPILPAQNSSGADTYKSGVLTFTSRNMEPPNVLPTLTESPNGACGYNNGTFTDYKCPGSSCCSESGWCGDEVAHCVPNCQFGYGRCDGPDVIASFERARENFMYDQQNGGVWYFDETTSPKLFWTWETIDTMTLKFYEIANSPKYNLGGISAWSLGENSGGFEYVRRLQNLTSLLPAPHP
ncbi:carbohydrate-binding module family 18 protein [Xylaria telfairii]|nr:carbohydrate-binding module family 18 protein [Xylaria telfairii]